MTGLLSTRKPNIFADPVNPEKKTTGLPSSGQLNPNPGIQPQDQFIKGKEEQAASPGKAALSVEHKVIADQFSFLVAPLVDHTGIADLSSINNFEEFCQFLVDQARIDHKSFRSPYAFLLEKGIFRQNKKYRPLLYLWFLSLHPGMSPGCNGLPSPESARKLLKQFVGRLIRISADDFVNHCLPSREGRIVLGHALVENQNKDLRCDLIKAVVSAAKQKGVPEPLRDAVTGHLSTWNWWNWGVNALEFEGATQAALAIVGFLDGREIQTEEFRAGYARGSDRSFERPPSRGKDSDISLRQVARRLKTKEAIKAHVEEQIRQKAWEITGHARRARELLEHFDAPSQIKRLLHEVWLLAADDRFWTPEASPDLPAKSIPFVRLGLLQKCEKFLHQLEKIEDVKGESGLQRVNDEIQRSLIGGVVQLPYRSFADGKITWVLGDSYPHFLQKMPVDARKPFEELIQFSDEIMHAHDMGAPAIVSFTTPQESIDPALLRHADQTTLGLNHIILSVWYGYKQHDGLSRSFSWAGDHLEEAQQMAEKFGFNLPVRVHNVGNRVKIRRACKAVKGLMVEIQESKKQGARVLKEQIKKSLERLLTFLEKGNILYDALVAAEMEGIEATLGLIKTLMITVATSIALSGLGALISRLALLGKGIRTAAQAAKTVHAIAEGAATTAVRGTGAGAAASSLVLASGTPEGLAIVRTSAALTRGARVWSRATGLARMGRYGIARTGAWTKGFVRSGAQRVQSHFKEILPEMPQEAGMGGLTTLQERIISQGSGQVQQRDSDIGWELESLATAITSPLTAFAPAGSIARRLSWTSDRNLATRLWSRYWNGGVGLTYLLADGAVETVQEYAEDSVRQVFIGDLDSLSESKRADTWRTCIYGGGFLKTGQLKLIASGPSTRPTGSLHVQKTDTSLHVIPVDDFSMIPLSQEDRAKLAAQAQQAALREATEKRPGIVQPGENEKTGERIKPTGEPPLPVPSEALVKNVPHPASRRRDASGNRSPAQISLEGEGNPGPVHSRDGRNVNPSAYDPNTLRAGPSGPSSSAGNSTSVLQRLSSAKTFEAWTQILDSYIRSLARLLGSHRNTEHLGEVLALIDACKRQYQTLQQEASPDASDEDQEIRAGRGKTIIHFIERLQRNFAYIGTVQGKNASLMPASHLATKASTLEVIVGDLDPETSTLLLKSPDGSTVYPFRYQTRPPNFTKGMKAILYINPPTPLAPRGGGGPGGADFSKGLLFAPN